MPRIVEERISPFWKTTDSSVKLYQGDSTDILQKLPPKSVNMCVTSPPYWGLRDYGTGTWEGGREGCDHIERTTDKQHRSLAKAGGQSTDKAACSLAQERQFAALCGKCGAKRIDQQIGSEKTPEEFILKMVWIFTYVRRLLTEDGTLWLNLGDTYGPRGLVGIPWRVALALQNDGWYFRQDIIWSKPSPMPESVKNRCTKAHEYVFLFSKSNRYYCDMESIREKSLREGDIPLGSKKITQTPHQGKTGNSQFAKARSEPVAPNKNKRSVWTVSSQGYEGAHYATFPTALIEPMIKAGCPEGGVVLDPFIGSGTTCVVATGLGRRSIGIDLSEKYLLKNAIPRIEGALLSRPAIGHLVPREESRGVKLEDLGRKAKTVTL